MHGFDGEFCRIKFTLGDIGLDGRIVLIKIWILNLQFP